MRRGAGPAVKRAATACIAASVLALVLMPSAGADQAYGDPAGDAGVGTDLVGLTITNDPSGLITMTFTAKDRLLENHVININIDADKNPATGLHSTFSGMDYVLFALPSRGGMGAWNGSTFVDVSPPSFRVQAEGNVQQFFINRADLGNTSGFTFVVETLSFDGTTARIWDRLPDSGLATYDLSFPVHLTLTKAGAGGGAVRDSTSRIDCGSTCDGVFQTGQSATLTATPDPGSVFAGWSGGGCSGMSATCVLTIGADTNVTARFDKRRVSLIVRKVGRGTVVSMPPAISCGTRCRGSFPVGPVTLVAKPSPGFRFSRWVGSCRGSRPTCRISLSTDVSTTAVFAKRR